MPWPWPQPPAWPGWVPRRSLLSAKELKMSQVRSLNTWPAVCPVSAENTCTAPPSGPAVIKGTCGGSAFSASRVGRSLPPYWSLRAEGTEGPGSLLASPCYGEHPAWYWKPKRFPIHSSLGQSFPEVTPLSRAQKLSDHLLKLLLCRMPFGKQLFFPQLPSFHSVLEISAGLG